MRKPFLIAALLGLCGTTAMAAEPLKLTIEGRIDVQGGGVNEKRTTVPSLTNVDASNNLKRRATRTGIVEDSTLDFKIDGIYSPDAKYGAFLRVYANTSVAATNQEKTFGDKAYIYFQHDKVGRVEAGSMPGAGALFEMDTVNLGRGTYGIEGFWSQWVDDRSVRGYTLFNTPQAGFGGMSLTQVLDMYGVNSDKKTRNMEFIIAPNMPSNYSGHYYSDANKINFFTKPLKELTVGVAYIPDMDSTGTVQNRAPKNSGPIDDRAGNPATFRNIISGGFMYETNIHKNVGIKTGVTGEFGKSKIKRVTNLRAYEAGLAFTFFKNIKFGGTYGSWLDSLSLKDKIAGNRHGSKYYTLSFSHQIDKFGYTLAGMRSSRAGTLEVLWDQFSNSPLGMLLPGTDISAQSFADPKKNHFRNVSLDIDYKVAPGFVPYAGVSFYDYKESHGARGTGYVVLVGSRLTF